MAESPIMTKRAYVAEAQPPTPSVLIVSFGESNSGGMASNALAFAWELASSDDIQMWNVNTDVYEAIDIGTNNNLDHANLAANLHAWELGTLVSARMGAFRDRTPHYVQTGQGGSRIDQWNVGGAYWTKFVSRVGNSLQAKNITTDFFLWFTLGLNDSVEGTPLTNSQYKAGVEELFDRIRGVLPGVHFIIAKLIPANPTAVGYNDQLQLIADVAADVVAIDTSDILKVDDFHYSYLGHKDLSGRMLHEVFNKLAYANIHKFENFTANLSQTGRRITSTGTGTANSIDKIDVTKPFTVTTYATGAQSDTMILALSDQELTKSWSQEPFETYASGFYRVGTAWRQQPQNRATGEVILPPLSLPTYIRMRGDGESIFIETSSDGLTWVIEHTQAGAFTAARSNFATAFSSAWLKVVVVVDTGTRQLDVWVNADAPLPIPLASVDALYLDPAAGTPQVRTHSGKVWLKDHTRTGSVREMQPVRGWTYATGDIVTAANTIGASKTVLLFDVSLFLTDVTPTSIVFELGNAGSGRVLIHVEAGLLVISVYTTTHYNIHKTPISTGKHRIIIQVDATAKAKLCVIDAVQATLTIDPSFAATDWNASFANEAIRVGNRTSASLGLRGTVFHVCVNVLSTARTVSEMVGLFDEPNGYATDRHLEYWCDESDGTTAFDSSVDDVGVPNGNHGTIAAASLANFHDEPTTAPAGFRSAQNEIGYTEGTGSNGAAVGVFIPLVNSTTDALGNAAQYSGQCPHDAPQTAGATLSGDKLLAGQTVDLFNGEPNSPYALELAAMGVSRFYTQGDDDDANDVVFARVSGSEDDRLIVDLTKDQIAALQAYTA